MTKLRISRYYPGGANVITRVLLRGRQKVQVRDDAVTMEAKVRERWMQRALNMLCCEL